MQSLGTKQHDVLDDKYGIQREQSQNEYGDIKATPAATMIDDIDPIIEKRVRRKLDKHLIPLLSALYLLAFLDRSNIGYVSLSVSLISLITLARNARIAGMEEDLSLTSSQYQWLLTIFYISYIIFGFLAIMWKVVPPHRWAAGCVFGWGLVSTVQAGAHSWGAMMALRFLMGLAEIAFGPGVPYLLSFFYLRHELGLRAGMFLSAAPLANTFAGALAYGITSGNPVMAKWRVLFLAEGLPTICMAVVAWFFLPDSPEKARFLTEEEKIVAKARGVRQAGTATRTGGIVWKDLLEGLTDPKGLILGESISLRVTNVANYVTVDVLLRKRSIFVATGVFANDFEGHGIYCSPRSGPDCASVLSFLPCGHSNMLCRRPDTTARHYNHDTDCDWWYRLCDSSCCEKCWSPVFWSIFGDCRNIPCDW